MSRDPHLSIRYGKLKITLKKDLKKCLEDGDYTFDNLKDLCHEYIPADKRNTVDSVEKLVDALEKKGALKINKVSMAKVLAEELELKTLKEKIEHYEWNYILGFSGKASKVAAQTPKKCWGALSGGTKEAVIILKTVLPTVAQAGAVGLAVLAVYNKSGILETSFRELLPYAMNLVGLQRGSLYFMLETSSLSSLQQLWTSYKDGSLKTSVKKVINEIDEVRKLTQGTEIDVTVEIDEDEYREAYWVLVLAKSHEFQDVGEKESGKSVQRLRQRRHSLSCRRDLLPPRDNTQFSWQEWRDLMEVESKLENEITRRMCVEKQNGELRKEIEVLKVIKDTAEEKKEKMALRMDVEKQNQELRKGIEVLKVIKDTAERMFVEKQFNEELRKIRYFTKKKEKTRVMALRKDLEKQNEKLRKEIRYLLFTKEEEETRIMALMDLEKQNEELRKEIEVLKVKDTAKVEKTRIMALRMDLEKQNEELRKEMEVLKVKDTAEVEKKEKMALRMDVEKQNEELRKEIRYLLFTKEEEKTRIMALMDLEKQNEELSKEIRYLFTNKEEKTRIMAPRMVLEKDNERLRKAIRYLWDTAEVEEKEKMALMDLEKQNEELRKEIKYLWDTVKVEKKGIMALMDLEKQNEKLRKEIRYLWDTAEVEKKGIMALMDLEKQNEELRKEIEVLKVKDTAEEEKKR